MSEEPRLEASLGNKATVFRVRGTFSRSDLPGVLQSCLGADYNPSIKSFAPQADENVNVATVTFNTTPNQLLSSDQTTFDEPNVTFDTHFHGLSVLFSPEAAHHHLDIIAICGLGGHAFGSFKERSGTHMWLRDSLPQDFQNARVLIYGYDSHIPGSTSFQTLESLATSLRNHVDGIKPLSGRLNETPIIFIAHSLGGLVVKQALIQSVKAESKLARCTRGALFFGVPNQGMHVSSLIPMAKNQPNEGLLHNLQQESELLRSQSRDFIETFVSREARIFCFYETKTSPTAEKGLDGRWRMNGEHVVLVGSASATHCRPWESEVRHVLGLNRDHSGLVKFKSGDEDYIKVRNVLGEIANSQYKLSRPKPMISEAEQKLTDQCLKAMGHTSPIDTMRRIESTKDELFEECNEWIKSDPQLEEWKKDQSHRLLWLSGDPGKGKTMLMMSLIQEFRKPKGEHQVLTFFFCQSTDSRLNTAHAVLCGLLWLMIRENPVLGCYLHEDYRHHNDFFDGPDAFVALCRIMTDMLQDVALPTVYILIDALDECDEGRGELLKFIGENATSAHSKAKWLVSSRNHLDIERGFKMRQHDVLSLELNTTKIAAAVEYFIKRKVGDLAKKNNYGDKIRKRVQKHLIDNAQSTFLWVALACKHLDNTAKRNISTELAKLPAGLSSLYDRMLDQLRDAHDHVLSVAIIKFIAIAKRPLSTEELLPLVAQEIPEYSEDLCEDLIDNDELLDLIKSCGSFVTVRDGIIFLIHQSAKDYLVREEGTLFSPRMKEEHCTIVDRSLLMLSNELMRGFHSHDHSHKALHSGPRQLKNLDYISCYWVDHLAEYQNSCGIDGEADFMHHEVKVYEFVSKHFLRWTELLCLLGQLKAAPDLLRRLETAAKRYTSERLYLLTHDATRFLARSYLAIEQDSSQIYNFGLIFAPEESLVRKSFSDLAPTSIAMIPLTANKNWSPLQQTFNGHKAEVRSVTFSPDGQQLASASYDHTGRIWDTRTGELSWTLQGHIQGVLSVSFSPDGLKLATTSQDTTVRLWNALSGDLLWTLQGHTIPVLATAFSPDGKHLASRSDDDTPRLWDTATGKLVRTFDGHTGPVWALDFSLDGKTLVTASEDNSIRLWNVATEKPSRVLFSHKGLVYLQMLSPHGQQLVFTSISGRSTIGLWNNSTNKLSWLNGHTGWVRKFAFSRDNRRLASSAGDFTVRLWNTATGECLYTFEGHSMRPSPIAFSPDGQRLAFSSKDGVVQLRDLTNGKLLQTISQENACLNNRIQFLVFSPDGRHLASDADQNFIQLWDIAISKPSETVERQTSTPYSITFDPNGQQVITVSNDSVIQIWDAATGESLNTLRGHTRPVTSTTFSLDGPLLATKSDDHTIRLWDVANNKNVATVDPYMHLDQVTVSPDFQRLASTSDGSYVVFLWCMDRGEVLWILAGHTAKVTSVVFSVDSQYLASSAEDGSVRLWSATTGELLNILRVRMERFSAISFSPDGLKLAWGSRHDILLWDTRTWALIGKIKGDNDFVVPEFPDGFYLLPGNKFDSFHVQHPTGELEFDPEYSWLHDGAQHFFRLRFSPDGQQLARIQYHIDKRRAVVERWEFASADSCRGHWRASLILLFRKETIIYSPGGRIFALAPFDGIQLYSAMTGETLKRLEGSRGKFEAFTFDASGQYLAAVCSSGDTIYIWNTNTAEVSMKLKGHKGKIDLLAFSPNGKQLVSSSGSHWGHSEESICLWNLETGKVLWRQEVYMLPFRPIRPSSDEQQQTSASDGTMFRPWDVSTGQVQRLRGHTYVIRSEAFSLNGYYMICVSEDSTVSLWHAATDDDPQIIAEIANLVTSVAFRPGAQQHISWSGNLPVRLWDPASGNTFWTFPWKSFQENLIRFRKLELNSSNCAESGFFFDTDTNWLSFNGRRLVWLPHEFRPELSAVHGNRIAIGSQSGAVFILEAHPNELIATGQIQ